MEKSIVPMAYLKVSFRYNHNLDNHNLAAVVSAGPIALTARFRRGRSLFSRKGWVVRCRAVRRDGCRWAGGGATDEWFERRAACYNWLVPLARPAVF